MILDLREFETFPAQASLQSQLGRLQIDFPGVMDVKSAQMEITVAKSGEEFYCQGEVRAEVKLECSRCLEPFDAELTNGTDFIVCAEEQRAQSKDVIDNEDYVFFRGKDLQADVSEMVRQAIILAVGMKPLCSEECRGLCPRCGANLNEETCSCLARQHDERWNALRRLSGQ
jgi:uncharacterized protein